MFDEVARLVQDKRHGKAREMLAETLGNMKDSVAVDLLIHLLEDEDVNAHALYALGKLNAEKAVPRIEQLLDHPRPLVRKEAKRALAKIDKAKSRRDT